MDVVLMSSFNNPDNYIVKRSLGFITYCGYSKIDLFRLHGIVPLKNWNRSCGLELKKRNPYEYIPRSPSA